MSLGPRLIFCDDNCRIIIQILGLQKDELPRFHVDSKLGDDWHSPVTDNMNIVMRNDNNCSMAYDDQQSISRHLNLYTLQI